MTSTAAARADGAPAEAGVSVVITNYNYGHFLADCIESVLGQSRPAAQVIVVEDGSRDGSHRVLAAYEGRVEVVRSANLGQAAAFNLGFARATGDVVMYLDADDLLRPEAVEVVLAHWSDDLALLSFGLETIDASGRGTGLHHFALDADEGDNRPRLLRMGTIKAPFAFSPTSGNAFGRAFLARTMPMPEEAWRICADAYLVRAAALCGRIRAVRRILAAYRVHGGNNYALPATLEPWSLRRGLRDVRISADALESLAESPQPLRDDPDGELIRAALRLRALEMRASVAAWTGEARAFRAAFRRSLAATLSGGLAVRDRLDAARLITGFARSVGRMRQPLAETPGIAVSARSAWRIPKPFRSARLEDALRRLQRPRWLQLVPYGRQLDFHERGIQQNLLAEGWCADLRDWQLTSQGPEAALELALGPSPGPVEVALCIAIPPEFDGVGTPVSIEGAAGRLWSGVVAGEATIRFFLERDPHRLEQPVWLAIACAAPRGPGRPRRPRPPAPRFILRHLTVTAPPRPPVHPQLHAGGRHRLAEVLLADPDNTDWTADPDGSISLRGAEGRLRMSLLAGSGPATVVLAPAGDPPAGWLRISCRGDDLFTGETGSTTPIELVLPASERGRESEHELVFAFTGRPDEATASLAFASIELRAHAAAPALESGRARPARPLLRLGQVVRFADNPGSSRFLQSGWDMPDERGPRNLGSEAVLAFTVPEGAEDISVRLSLAPLLPPVPGFRHVVGFSVSGEILHAVELLGEGEVVVPVAVSRLDPDGGLRLTLHSAYAPAGDEPERPSDVALASVELVSIGLRGRMRAADPLPSVAGGGYPVPEFLRLLEEASAVLAGDAPPLAQLLELRAAVADAIRHADIRVVETIAASPGSLARLDRLGAVTAGAPPGDDERAAIAAFGAGGTDAGERPRAFVMAMLLLPAFRAPLERGLDGIPPMLLGDPSIVASYLGRSPELTDAAEVAAYVAYLERLYDSIDADLARHPPESPRHGFAVLVLGQLRTTKALFGRENLAGLTRRRGACIERLLVQSGARLSLPRSVRGGKRRLRLGVLVRHVLPRPEGWALLGMYRALDRSRLDPVLITLDAPEGQLATGDRFGRAICLGDLGVEQAVAAIRGLELDVFVLGAYFTDYERLSAIVAHRLAPLQIVSAAVAPTTIGLRSFDRVLTCAASEPPDPRPQYTERVAWIAGPVQCCYDFAGAGAGDAPTSREQTRAALAVPPDAVLLTSGAMAHKIHAELLAAWAEILSRTPGARLVLYPLASNWSLGFAPDLLRARIDTHLDRAGVTHDRVVLLGEIPPDQVRQLLAASDLYLDSFPYTGATTVCEALSCMLPVIALAGDTLRGLTGASWVLAYGLPELVASSADGYVACAVRVACDAAERDRLRARLHAAATDPPHYRPEAFGAAFSEAILDAAQESGLFPDLPARGEIAPEPYQPAQHHPAAAVATGRGATAGARVLRALSTQRVVIVGLGRTGSSLLCHLLAKAPNVRFDYELFNPSEIQYAGDVVTDPEAVRARDADPVGWLEGYFRAAEAQGLALVGFKLFVHHNYQMLQHVVADERCRLICLQRNNVLAMYSSLRIAQATGAWAAFQSDAPQDVRLTFDPADFEGFERDVADANRVQMELLAKAGREVLFVEYQAIARDETRRRLERFLGHRLDFGRNTLFRKQNRRRIIDRFEDPDQVMRYLRQRNRAIWSRGG